MSPTLVARIDVVRLRNEAAFTAVEREWQVELGSCRAR